MSQKEKKTHPQAQNIHCTHNFRHTPKQLVQFSIPLIHRYLHIEQQQILYRYLEQCQSDWGHRDQPGNALRKDETFGPTFDSNNTVVIQSEKNF